MKTANPSGDRLGGRHRAGVRPPSPSPQEREKPGLWEVVRPSDNPCTREEPPLLFTRRFGYLVATSGPATPYGRGASRRPGPPRGGADEGRERRDVGKLSSGLLGLLRQP